MKERKKEKKQSEKERMNERIISVTSKQRWAALGPHPHAEGK